MERIEVLDIINGKKRLSDATTIVIGTYRSIYYFSNLSNCKLCTIENIGSVFNYDDKKILTNFNKFLKGTTKQVFFTHVINKSLVDKISKHYKMIYCQEVPIGYGKGLQYHCSFLIDSNNPNYGKRIDEFIENNKILKPIIEENNADNLIEQFIKKASDEEINKLRSYKQPKRRKNLIEQINQKVI